MYITPIPLSSKTFDIDIDKLFGFVCGATCSLLKFPKTKKISRIHSQNQHFQKLGFDKITNRKEAEIAIKTSLIKTYTLFGCPCRSVLFCKCARRYF